MVVDIYKQWTIQPSGSQEGLTAAISWKTRETSVTQSPNVSIYVQLGWACGTWAKLGTVANTKRQCTKVLIPQSWLVMAVAEVIPLVIDLYKQVSYSLQLQHDPPFGSSH